MECFFLPDIDLNSITDNTVLPLPAGEAKHAIALRLKPDDHFLITNGQGLMLSAIIVERSKKEMTVRIKEDISDKYPSNKIIFDLFVSPLDDSARTEFIIEKATELGASNIYLIKMENSSFRTSSFDRKLERLNKKAIAAIKQSQNRCLPEIHELSEFDDFLKKADNYDAIILGDPEGGNVENAIKSLKKNTDKLASPKVAIIVGPEGGISNKELEQLSSFKNLIGLRVSTRRLRSETASIAMMSFIASV